jgi:Ca2+/Na+ antiporter
MRKPILVRILTVVGCRLMIAGIVFVAQRNSVVGPQSSLMYSNPQWTVNGFAVSIIGLVVLTFGVLIRFIKNI